MLLLDDIKAGFEYQGCKATHFGSEVKNSGALIQAYQSCTYWHIRGVRTGISMAHIQA